MARSLHLSFICIPRSTRALDQGGVEPRQAVSPRPGGQGRYRFATASAVTLVVHKYSKVSLSYDFPIQVKVNSANAFFFPASAFWPVWPGQSTVSVGRKLYRSI